MMRLLPEETVSKLDSVLTGIIANPRPPAMPRTLQLDKKKQELDEVKQKDYDSEYTKMMMYNKAYDAWKKDYDKFLATANSATAPAPAPAPAAPPPFPPPPPPPSSPPLSPLKEEEPSSDDDDDNWSDAESAVTPSEEGEGETTEAHSDSELVTRTPTYDCPHCQKSYKRQSGLTRHIKDKHKKWVGKGETPPGLSREKLDTFSPSERKTGRGGIVFYHASSRR